MEEFFNPPARECRKNPGHEQFRPTSSFDPQHLPSLLLWSLLKHKSKLTVKLFVKSVSPRRPEAFPGLYCVRGEGSGYVTDIDNSDPDCLKMTIDTAAHVVFDAEEAANTIAKFYFSREQEVFQLEGPAELLVLNRRMDTCRIMYTIDTAAVQGLILGNNLPALEYALSPSVLPDVDNLMNISLLQTVVARYKAHEFSWLSFVFHEIKCLKNITFISNCTRVLEIEINFSLTLLYDVILLIIALKSHTDDIMNRMEDIVRWNHTHVETDESPYITLYKQVEIHYGFTAKSASKLSLNRFIEMDKEEKSIVPRDFKIPQNEVLYTLMSCFITSSFSIDELNRALTDFCQCDISARFNQSGHIVFKIPVTSVRVPGKMKMSLEVNLQDLRVEEEYDHIAVLISHPHDMAQRITVGKLERRYSRKIKYTTPSCPGSSGGPVWVLPKKAASREDIENIRVFTHSYVSGNPEFGIGQRL